MEKLFETMDNAKQLAMMFEPVEGMQFSENFWSTLVAEEDPLQNTLLLRMIDHWEQVPGTQTEGAEEEEEPTQ